MNARYPDMSDLQLAMTARFANKYKLDTADVRQELEIIKIECAGSYDAGRGSARETYYLRELENRCKRTRAQTRHGVALDDEEVSGDAAEAEAAIARARAGGVADWRVRSDEEAAERIAVLPEHLRKFAQRIVEGCSCKKAAEELGLTDRRGRQAVVELVEFFSANTTGAQPSLF